MQTGIVVLLMCALDLQMLMEVLLKKERMKMVFGNFRFLISHPMVAVNFILHMSMVQIIMLGVKLMVMIIIEQESQQ